MPSAFVLSRAFLLTALVLTLSCSSGGGGGGGGVSGTVKLSGTVTAVAPVVNTVIAVRDSTSKPVFVSTGPTGTYDATLGLTLPVITRAPNPSTGTFMYSYTDTEGNTNIHPLTDAILRIWYAVKHPGGNIDSDFIASAPFAMPTADEIAFIRAVVTMVVRDLLNAVLTGGTNADTFDLIKTPPGGLNFNTLLAGLRVSTGSDGSLSISVIAGSELDTLLSGGFARSAFLDGSVMSLLPDTTPPAAPANLQATNICNTKGLVTWPSSTSTDVTTYKVYEETAGELATVTSTAYVFSYPSSLLTFTFKVQAIDDAGNLSPLSSPASLALDPGAGCALPRPQNPLSTLPTVTALSGNAIRITWAGSGGYDIEYLVYSSASPTPIARTIMREFVDFGLSPSTNYCYSVSYKNIGGESPKTAPVCASTLPGIPPAPKNVLATAASGTMTVQWDAVSNSPSYSYNVYVALVSGITKANYKTLANGALHSGVTGTSHAVTGLTSGKTYYSVVTAVTASGEGAESAEVHATP